MENNSFEYRPISILPILSKVFKRVILQQLSDHIESKSIYLKHQSGFRKSHSTLTVLLKLKDDIKRAMNRSEVTLAIFADFSKAFDTVDYKTLLQHLNNLGFSHQVLRLIGDYLTNRKQYVQVDDKISERLEINFGVPQGSILGPVLFNLYVTSIDSNGPSNYLLYADDTTLLRHTKVQNLQATITSMQEELDNVNTWSSRKNLSLNSKKTKMMLFSSRQLKRLHQLNQVKIDIMSDHQKIERVDSFQILGVCFNDHLGWKNHINVITKKCYSLLKSLKIFKNSANWRLRKTLVESLVLSKINYCNLLLSDAPKYELVRLQKVQNAAAGFVLKRHASLHDVLELKWLPVEEGISSTFAKTAHKAIHDDGWPSYLRLSIAHPGHGGLRSEEENTINIRRNWNGSFNDTAAKCFNDLPNNVKNIDSKNLFDKKCFNYYFDRATARILSLG